MDKYKNSILEQYIIALENPESNGWDSKTKTWGHAVGKGMDRNQIGIGGDRNNVNIKALIGLQNWDKVRITEAQEREARYKNFDYFNGVIDRNISKLSYVKRMLAMGLLYHGYGPLLWQEGNALNKILRYGSDDDFSKSIYDFYRYRNPERAKNHDNFVKQQKKSNEEINRKQGLSLKNIPGIDRHHKVVVPADATRVVGIPVKRRLSLSQMPLPISIRWMK